MSRPRVSVLVPVKDRRERMLRCLDALLAQDHPSYEVIVLDNESSDGTAEACRERAAGATVPVRVAVLAGSVGRVRNRGALLARGDVLAYTDSDCLPEPGWLTAGERPFADSRVGIVTGRTRPEEDADGDWPATIAVSGPTTRFESCNVLFRRDAFVASAGFDEEVGHFYEDTAAGFAMLRGGWRAAYAGDAVVLHDVTYPGWRWHLKRAQRHRNLAAIVRRYPELRRELLWCRVFLRPRDALITAALLGAALAPLDRRALVLLAPYLWHYRPAEASAGHPLAQLKAAIYHLAVYAGTVRGAVRHRRLIL